ncbi:Sensor histidine kinase ResE [bacterium HR17]|uniref:histidine kinase n=1 Tax=Candidatus Fervidibacter japonicus TaxID=2035412 RepID=A0A2H5X8S0_9BACT|nr:Sensor histidine kinase ResE [bacterium HR17]
MEAAVPANLKAFLQEVLNTPTKQELLVFFATNQAMDTVKGLAVWLGRPEAELWQAAEALVQAGLLHRSGEGRDAVYSYRPHPELRPLVDAFVALYQSARVQLLQEMEHIRRQAQSAQEQLRALQWEQSRFRLVLASMLDGVLVLLPDGTVSYLNDAAAQLIGRRPAEVIGRNLSEIETPLTVALHKSAAEVFQPPHPALAREWHLPDATVVRGNLMPVFNETHQCIGVVAVLSDITAVRRREREQREVLAVLAHDIKSPLTAIRGFALSGVKGFLGEVPANAQRAFQVIAEQADRVLSMIQQMVRLMTDLPGGTTLRPVRFDLRECVNSIANAYEGECAERGLTLSVELASQPVWVHADRDLMERAIANLLSNAVKYNREGGAVWVRVWATEHDAVVEVEDTGVGIPPAELPLVFQQFYRASNALGEGSGVGLAFVRQVVEAHGGRVEVTSSVGQGSLFRVVLPLATRPSVAAALR